MPRWLRKLLIGAAAFYAVAFVVGLALTAQSPPAPPPQRDVFGFAELKDTPRPRSAPLRRYAARDGAQLAYRFYPSEGEQLLVFVHGSSYHGAYLHALADALSRGGLAQVALPNLRGHYQSGRARGDVAYIGQLEDDLADLIGALRERGHDGPVIVGGHSSGGGLAVRFAGGEHAALASGYLLLSPTFPLAPTLRDGDAGGWAVLHGRRLAGLIILGILGVHAFDGLPIIAFNKPEEYWDGTETLVYSYRLNQSYHPRTDYAPDLAATGERVLVVIGADDEANAAAAYGPLFADHNPAARVVILPGVNHFGVADAAATLDVVGEWLR